MMEYYRDEERTNQAIRDGLYHTGDTAYKDEDGYFWYVGRTDDIKSSVIALVPLRWKVLLWSIRLYWNVRLPVFPIL